MSHLIHLLVPLLTVLVGKREGREKSRKSWAQIPVCVCVCILYVCLSMCVCVCVCVRACELQARPLGKTLGTHTRTITHNVQYITFRSLHSESQTHTSVALVVLITRSFSVLTLRLPNKLHSRWTKTSLDWLGLAGSDYDDVDSLFISYPLMFSGMISGQMDWPFAWWVCMKDRVLKAQQL